ncbi:MAG TPA: hypothetical protein VF721_00960 [Pyrinomonadaceae bacterium]|jgi:hypothetical protein
MRREDLERYLERGDCFGFVKQTNSNDYSGWILLNKLKPNDRYLSLLSPGEEPEFVIEQEFIRQNPYHISIVELKREIHESERYETNEDFRLREYYDFSNLDEIEIFLKNLGFILEDIKWSSEINAP